MSSTDNKIKWMTEQLKGNEVLLKTCKDIAGVSGHHSPDGLANYFSSTWSRQRHVIKKLQNKIQELKENGHTLSTEGPIENLKGSVLFSLLKTNNLFYEQDLAGAMDVDTSNSNISTIVKEMKDTFTSMKNDVINLKDMVKVKKEEIKNVQDLEKTNTNRIVELEKEMDDLKKRNNYLTLDLEQSQEKLKSATNLVSDLEHKIRDLQIGNDRKALEIEGLLQRYEEAGEIVSNLQTELDDTKQLNQFLNLQIKASENAKVDDVANWEQQKKELESQLESLRTAEFQTNAQVLSLKLELGDMKVQKDGALEALKKLQVNEPKKDNHILELEKEIAILQREKLELETIFESLKSKDSKTEHPKSESRDHNTTEFSWKSGYDFTTPKNHQGNDQASNNNVLVERKVVELLRQKSELGQQLKRLNQEKDNLISQHETDINQIEKKKENLAKLLKKCADQYETTDLLLRRTTERLQSSLREKSDLFEEKLRNESKVSHLKSGLKHLKTKLKDEKAKHRMTTKNIFRKKKITNPDVTQEDDGKITALTQEIEKLQEKIADLKTKMTEISKELEQSHQECEKAEEKFARASQQRQELENRLDIINEEKGKLSSQLEDIQKENKELTDQLFTLNEEKIELQSNADCLEEDKSDLSTQLSEARKQYQDLEEGFAAVYAEKKQLQVLNVSLEKERDNMSARINENHHQGREHSLSDEGQDLEWDQEIDLDQEPIQDFAQDDNQELEWDQEIPVQKPKPCFTEESQDLEWDQEIKSVQSNSYHSPSSSFEIERHGPKFELRKSPQQCQVLDQTFQRKKTIKKQSSNQTENGDGLSAKIQEANNKYQELEQECELLLGEKLEFQTLADSLAEDNYKLSSQIGQEYEERRNLEDKLNCLEVEVENQEFSTKLKEENSTLSISLESVQNQCKELEQRIAAAAQDKEEFERETLKWKEEKSDLLEQIQNQKQNQKSDSRRKVALKTSAIIDQEITKVLDREIAQIQIRKEQKKLETAERDRL
ncbi:girdin-like, partial [Lytechinus pictus]|uniref:girdin-like n=1 Tax=Lytechinus pictus TaxID=7653 RepID=UPI0030B9D804